MNPNKKNSDMLIRINWSINRDAAEDRPFDESAKGLGSEILWAISLILLLTVIVMLIWLVV